MSTQARACELVILATGRGHRRATNIAIEDHQQERAMNDGRPRADHEGGRFRGSRALIGLVVLGAVAAFFLLAEHRAHLFGALPWLLLLACPLMHVFMHHGHGGQGGRADHQDADRKSIDSTTRGTPS
jgi:hypothetical protein